MRSSLDVKFRWRATARGTKGSCYAVRNYKYTCGAAAAKAGAPAIQSKTRTSYEDIPCSARDVVVSFPAYKRIVRSCSATFC